MALKGARFDRCNSLTGSWYAAADTHGYRVRSVAFRNVSATQHEIAYCCRRRITMVRIDTRLPKPVDRYLIVEAVSGLRVGKRRVERSAGFEDEFGVLRFRVVAFRDRCRKEMRITVRRRDVNAADRL